MWKLPALPNEDCSTRLLLWRVVEFYYGVDYQVPKSSFYILPLPPCMCVFALNRYFHDVIDRYIQCPSDCIVILDYRLLNVKHQTSRLYIEVGTVFHILPLRANTFFPRACRTPDYAWGGVSCVVKHVWYVEPFGLFGRKYKLAFGTAKPFLLLSPAEISLGMERSLLLTRRWGV